MRSKKIVVSWELKKKGSSNTIQNLYTCNQEINIFLENSIKVALDKTSMESPFTDCNEINMSFNNSKNQNLNLLEDKPYKCPFGNCNRQYTFKYRYNIHLRTHVNLILI